MKSQEKKIKLNIKGKFKKFWSETRLKFKAKQLGVHLDKIEHPSKEQVHVIVSGETHKIWKIVNWSQKGGLFLSVTDIKIEFVK